MPYVMWIDGVTAFFDPYLDKRIRPGQQVSIPCAGLVSQHFTSKTDAVSVFDLILRLPSAFLRTAAASMIFGSTSPENGCASRKTRCRVPPPGTKGQRSQRITLIETCGQRNVSR